MWGAIKGGGKSIILLLIAAGTVGIFILIILTALLTCAVGNIPLVGGGQCNNSAGIAGMMLQMGGVFLGIGAGFFDWTITRWLIQASERLAVGGGIGSSISAIWIVLRDLVNLVFIGGLIWASINIILGSAQKVGRIIVTIIIAALLVNFSYFFTGAILDASHFTSRMIYQEALVIDIDSEERVGDNEVTSALQGGRAITTRFMNATKLASIYELDEDLSKMDGAMLFMMGLIGVVFMGATFFIFFSMAALFIQRFIVIVILLMTSPIGILAFIDIPGIQKFGKAWWSALYSQAVFPVVFLLFAAAALKVLENASAVALGDGTLVDLIANPTFISAAGGTRWSAALDLVVIYALGFGLLYFAMKISMGIARQEEFTPPTTGQFYGAYKKVIPTAAQAVGKTLGGAAKWVGGTPLALTGGKRNLGDALTLKPLRDELGPVSFSRTGRQDKEYEKAKKDEWDQARTKYAAVLSQDDAPEEEKQAAYNHAVDAFSNLSEDQREKERKNEELTQEEKKAEVTKTGKRKALAQVVGASKNPSEVERAKRRVDTQNQRPPTKTGASGTPTEDSQQLDATQTQQLQKVVTAIEGLTQEAVRGRLTEKQRDRVEFTQEKLAERAEEKRDLMALAQDRRSAKMLVDKLRTNGPDGTSQVAALPPEVLEQPEMAQLLNVEEFSAINRRQAEPGKEPREGEISEAQMQNISMRAQTKVVKKYNESTQAVERGRKAPVAQEELADMGTTRTDPQPSPQPPNTPPNQENIDRGPDDEN
ncbi:MAG: hypothetical protein ACJKTH_00965 [Patescibacteria group bacterium UBA2163]